MIQPARQLRTAARLQPKPLAAAVAMLVAGAVLPFSDVAYAQAPDTQAGAQLDEILVTARRREESLQDIPLVIQAFSAAEIERRGISTVADIARYTPGLVVDQGISLQDVRPAIRGLPATRGRPPVGILIDGVDISTQALGNAGGGNLLNLSLLDLERIEVVKGPQSALYGRAAFAGAVNYVTQRPTEDLTGRVSAEAGRFDRGGASGMLSGTLIDDVLRFRANAAYSEFGGDRSNPVSGASLNGRRSAGASLALEVTPSDDFRVYTRVAYSDDRADQRAIQALSGFTGAVARPGPDTPAGQAIATAVAGGVLFPGSLPSNTPVERVLSFSEVTGLSIDPRTGRDFPGSDSDTLLGTLNMEWDLGTATLVSITGYARQKDRLNYDGDFFGLPDDSFPDGVAEPLELFDSVDFDNRYRQFSHELRLQNFAAETLRWAVGGLYWQSEMKQSNNSLRALGGFPFDGFRPPVAALSGSRLFLNSIEFGAPQGRDIDSWSIYGLVEYDVTQRLTVTAEARYIDEKQIVTRSEFVQTLFAPLLAPPPPGTEQATVTDNAFLPRLSVDYALADEFMIYASIARGFKPGGVSELNFGTPLEDSGFKSEKLWNYELGMKTTVLDGQMLFDAAVFLMDWKDLQTTRLVENPATASGVSNVVINAGGAEVIGLDLSTTIRPAALPGLTIGLAYTYLGTRYTDFTEPTTTALPLTDFGNCTIAVVAGATVCNVTGNGNRLERAPRHALTGNLYYEADLSANITGFIDVAAQYQGSRYLNSANSYVLPSYTNLDLVIGARGEHLSASLFIENLTDSERVRTAQENFDLSTFGRSINVFAPPRRVYGVRLAYDF